MKPKTMSKPPKSRTHDWVPGHNNSICFDADLLARSLVLIQHEDSEMREYLQSVLESWGCMVFTAQSKDEAAHKIAEYPIRFVLKSAGPNNYVIAFHLVRRGMWNDAFPMRDVLKARTFFIPLYGENLPLRNAMLHVMRIGYLGEANT